MSYKSIIIPASIGIVSASLIGLYTLPIIAIGSGAIVTVVCVNFMKGAKEYAVSGTLFLFGFAVVLSAQPFPVQYSSSIRFTLFVVSLLSFGFILLKNGVKLLLRRVEKRYSDADVVSDIFDIGATVGTFGYALIHAFQFSERLVRSVVLSIVGPSTFTLSVVQQFTGLSLRPWLMELLGIIFIVTVLLGFYTLSTWSRTVRLVKKVTKKSSSEDVPGRVEDEESSVGV